MNVKKLNKKMLLNFHKIIFYIQKEKKNEWIIHLRKIYRKILKILKIHKFFSYNVIFTILINL